MSDIRWFLWVFTVLATLDILADIDLAGTFGALEGLRGPMWQRIVIAAVKALMVVWAVVLTV